ncbi:MAG: carboxylesterase/lipase family protein [Syntrophales bacterium]
MNNYFQNMRLIFRLNSFFFIWLSLVVISPPGTAAWCADSPPTVKLAAGIVQGTQEHGVAVFRGIPYAAPPVGNLRWQPPQPVQSWQGVRSAASFGPACPQPEVSELEGGGDLGKLAEDCLYLNIWKPVNPPAKKLPVLVWIHGGGFLVGAGSGPEYPGDKLARKGVLVVSLNYRLGPLGFLVHEDLEKESPAGVSGNYGLLDQIAALQWIRNNIGAFGGDPDRITLFGESAGAASISLLMLSPPARGLFHRAIMQSATATTLPYIMPLANGSYDQARETGRKLAAGLGCEKGRDALAAMRAKTPEEIMAAARSPLDDIAFSNEGLLFAPVYDGRLIPGRPEILLAQGTQPQMPVIIGTNKDEATLFTGDLSYKTYKGWISKHFGSNEKEIEKIYPLGDETDFLSAANRFLTALWFTEPARFLARVMTAKGAPVYRYQFTRVPESFWMAGKGAYHGVEIPYVFGNVARDDPSETDKMLSETITAYWIRFAAQGNPNTAGLTAWPAYDRASEPYLELGESISVKSGLDRQACDLIEKIR